MEKSQDVLSVVVRAGGDVVGSTKSLSLKIPSQNSGDQMLFLRKGQKCFPFFPMQTCAQHFAELDSKSDRKPLQGAHSVQLQSNQTHTFQ